MSRGACLKPSAAWPPSTVIGFASTAPTRSVVILSEARFPFPIRAAHRRL